MVENNNSNKNSAVSGSCKCRSEWERLTLLSLVLRPASCSLLLLPTHIYTRLLASFYFIALIVNWVSYVSCLLKTAHEKCKRKFIVYTAHCNGTAALCVCVCQVLDSFNTTRTYCFMNEINTEFRKRVLKHSAMCLYVQVCE